MSDVLEQLDIPASFVDELESAADAQAVNGTEVPRQAADELFAGNFTDRLVEMNQQRGVDFQRCDRSQLLRVRINQGRVALRRNDRVGMAIERDGHGDAFVPARV